MNPEIGCIASLCFAAADKKITKQIIFAEKQNEWRHAIWSKQAKKYIKTETLF